jgi:hypothetical protein
MYLKEVARKDVKLDLIVVTLVISIAIHIKKLMPIQMGMVK